MNRRRFLELATLSSGFLAGCSERIDPTPTTRPPTTSVTTEAPTRTSQTTETPLSSVDIGVATNRLAIGDSPNSVSAWPSVSFSTPVEIDGRTSFEITNTDTERSVTVSVTSDRSAIGRNVALIVYDYEGRLRDGNEVVSVTPPDADGTVRLDATVEGDSATFSEKTFASYRVTMSKGGTVVGSTGAQEYPIGHQKAFASSVEDGTLEWSFDAGELPSDADRTGWVQTDEEKIDASEVEYDAASNRFVASVPTDRVPKGSHLGAIRLRDSETNVYLVKLEGPVTV